MSKFIEKQSFNIKTHWLQYNEVWEIIDNKFFLNEAIKICDDLAIKENCKYRVRDAYNSKILYITE